MKVRPVYYIIFHPIGGFICWVFNGFKNILNKELLDEKIDRNVFVGMVTVGLISILIGILKTFYL